MGDDEPQELRPLDEPSSTSRTGNKSPGLEPSAGASKYASSTDRLCRLCRLCSKERSSSNILKGAGF